MLTGYGPYKLCIQCITSNHDIFEKVFEISQSKLNIENFLFLKSEKTNSFELSYNPANKGDFYDYLTFFETNP